MERLVQSPSRRDFLRAGLVLGASAVLLDACGGKSVTRKTADQIVSQSSPLPSPTASTSPDALAPWPTATEIATAETTRLRINLPESHFINHGPTNLPRLSLTFDDFFGLAAADYLEQLLDIGQTYSAKFTLFPAGKALDEHRKAGRSDVWRRAVQDGHIIGNHTYHHYIHPDPPHKSFAALSPAEISSELSLSQTALNDVLEYEYPTFLMRPPGGSGGYTSSPSGSNRPASLKVSKNSTAAEHSYALDQVAAHDLYMTMWSGDSNNTKNDAGFIDKLFRHGPEQANNGAVILIHPTTLTTNGVKQVLDKLTSTGLNCITVPELFAPIARATNCVSSRNSISSQPCKYIS